MDKLRGIRRFRDLVSLNACAEGPAHDGYLVYNGKAQQLSDNIQALNFRHLDALFEV